MALSLDELVKKYKAGTMTDADLKESGYMMHQVEYSAKAEMDEHGNMKNMENMEIKEIISHHPTVSGGYEFEVSVSTLL